ncbi:hypothetical protein CSB20_02470 [bacterium DOLZORAL124_64_63]|nr:MAG: hypothetical protein CSB20_02470 [bacterium DOLZORAL124_64_63]
MSARREGVVEHAVYRPRQESRRSLWRRPGWPGLILLGLILALMAGGAVYGLRSETFAVTRISTGSYRFTAGQDLDRILGSFLGRNLWTLSATEVADSLATLAWIRDPRIERQWPGDLVVEFRECRPVLSLEEEAPGGGTRVLVDDGCVLPFPGHLPMPGLPVLVGVSCVRDSVSGREKLDPAWAPQVMELLTALAQTGLETVAPVDFLVAREEGFAILLREGWGSLQVGREDFAARLDRYMAARENLEPGLRMDLRFRERIVCSRN